MKFPNRKKLCKDLNYHTAPHIENEDNPKNAFSGWIDSNYLKSNIDLLMTKKKRLNTYTNCNCAFFVKTNPAWYDIIQLHLEDIICKGEFYET